MSTAAPRRNDPCPCGSGRKYKQCCARGGSGAAGAGVRPGSSRASPASPAPAPASAPADPAALVATAERARAAGDLARAEAAYRRALAADPRRPDALAGLGAVRLARGDAAAAAALLDRALPELRGRAARQAARLAHADACLQCGRGADALASARAAVDAAPREPGALAVKAMVEERTNDLDAAAATAARALAVAPAHASVGTMAARIDRRRGDAAAALARLDALLARRDLSPFQRQAALHERAVTLEAAGHHDEAWTAFVAAGRAVAEDPAAVRLDRDAWPRRVEACRRGLTRTLLEGAPSPSAGDLPFRPAFLVGFPRSGTTMTESVLAAHPVIRTTDEQPFLGDVKRSLAAATGGSVDDLPGLIARLRPEHVAAGRTEYARRVTDALGPVNGVLVDKLPLNLVDVGLVDALFPEARLIVALRDPRDVCLSCFQQWFGLNTAMVHFLDPEDTVRFYATVMGGWLDTRDALRIPRLEVRYEDTTADLEGQARRMLETLGVPWDDAVLAFHERARTRAISTPSYAAVAEPVHRRAVARWRRYERHLATWHEPLARFVAAFGYDDPA